MNITVTNPMGVQCETMNRWFGNYPAIVAATHQRLAAATDFYVPLFRKYHPVAAAPEPTRGWTWVDEDRQTSVEKSA